jgi:acylphosphatase
VNVVGTAMRRVFVRGRVQGVGFRAWVAQTAAARDLAGWVRNRRDGSVEAVFVGPIDPVSAMIESCGQGPLAARVASVEATEADVSDLDLRHPGQRFSVLPTA